MRVGHDLEGKVHALIDPVDPPDLPQQIQDHFDGQEFTELRKDVERAIVDEVPRVERLRVLIGLMPSFSVVCVI